MLVGVISDTHVPTQAAALPPAVADLFAGCQAILHAGDLVEIEVLADLERIAPVHAVRGNMDLGAAAELPARRVVELGAFRIGMIHGAGPAGALEDAVFAELIGEGVDVMVFGHSHCPLIRRVAGRLMLNPGSPTIARSSAGRTVALLTLDGAASARIVSVESR
jgi:putative phosphoesterase